MRRRARTSATSPSATSAAPRPSSRSSEDDSLSREHRSAAARRRGGPSIVLLTAGAVSAAGLLELDALQRLIPDEHPRSRRDRCDVDAPEPGKPQTIMALGTDGRWAPTPAAASARTRSCSRAWTRTTARSR